MDSILANLIVVENTLDYVSAYRTNQKNASVLKENNRWKTLIVSA